MRIALMTNNYKPFMGGVPISVERLKKGLEKLGHEVTVFAPTYENQIEEKGVFRYRTLFPKIIGGIVLPNPFDRQIEKEFRKNTYDIIHVHHPVLIGNTAVYLAKKYKIPLVFTYHTRYEQYMLSYVDFIKRLNVQTNQGIEKKLFPLYLNSFLRHCNHIFAPTPGMKDYLQDICKVAPDKVSVLPTGINLSAYTMQEAAMQEVRRRYQAQDCPLFLSVSRMANEKNVSFLLKGIARVKEQYTGKFKVLLVGDGPERGTFINLCRKLQITNEVIFTGQISNEELTPYFAAADAFLFASKTETQGIVILEAFAGKTPVYAVKASGVSDLVRDGWNGRLCEEDADAFARQLLPVLQGREDIKGLGENAYETALTFGEDAVALKAVQQYNRVIVATAQEYIRKSDYYNGKQQISYFNCGR